MVRGWLVLCYKDMTFCSFYADCWKRMRCERPLTPEVIAAAQEWWGEGAPPIMQFAHKPDCHEPLEAIGQQ